MSFKSDTKLVCVLDDADLCGRSQLIKSLSATVLTRYNLINASTHRKILCGYALNSFGC